MQRIFVLLVLALISCSEQSIPQQVKAEAKRSDAVWLCDVDTTGSAVRYRSKRILTMKVTAIQFAVGQILPVSGPAIQSGTRYGDEALVFLSARQGTSRVAANFILALHDARTRDGMSREAVIRLIQEGQKR